MKRILKIGGLLVLIAVFALIGVILYVHAAWDTPVDRPAPNLIATHDSTTIARGEYLYKVTWQCWGCHQSAPQNADAPPSGGGVFDLRTTGPGFGIYYSSNITPDSASGIGAWTDGEIVQAIREGITKDRRLLFPVMPVDWLKGLSDEDALALVSYLRSIPPVHNVVPENEPSLVAKALFTFGVLKSLPRLTEPVTAPGQGATVEYGRYVATAASGCADCHTPRNLQNGEFYLDSLFAGSTIAFGEAEHEPIAAYARNLTPDETTGIGQWTEKEFIMAVTAGLRPDGTVLDPHMPYPSYKHLTPTDLQAIYRYLQSLAPIRRTTPPVRMSRELLRASRGAERGKLLFQAHCGACHGLRGTRTDVTSVKLGEAISIYTEDDLRNVIQEGIIELKMPGFSKTLSREDIDDIIAHLRTWRDSRLQ